MRVKLSCPFHLFNTKNALENNLVENIMKYSLRKNKSIIFIISFLFILGTAFPTEAMEFLTEEEKAYIADRTVIKAAFMQGAAPISFVNSNNEVSGISSVYYDGIGL